MTLCGGGGSNAVVGRGVGAETGLESFKARSWRATPRTSSTRAFYHPHVNCNGQGGGLLITESAMFIHLIKCEAKLTIAVLPAS